MKPILKMKAPSGIRDFSVCNNQTIFLALIYDTVKIYSTYFTTPILTIKLDYTPHSAKLSYCGKYFYVHDSNNIIYLYHTKTGTIIQQIYGAPPSTKNIKISKNAQKIIYGSTQILCVWSIKKCMIDIRTQHWKNINVYDINDDGSQFVLGTYSGEIYVMEIIEVGRYNQIKIKRHESQIVSICCHKNKIISSSQDGQFLISTIEREESGQKVLKYNEMKFKNIPKQIQSIGLNFYMYNNEGLTWFNRLNALAGFTDHKMYRTFINSQNMVIFVSLYAGEFEWWPAHIFKTADEIERDKIDQIVRQKNNQSIKQKKNCIQQGLSGKQNWNQNAKNGNNL